MASKNDIPAMIGTILSGVLAGLGFLWSIGAIQLVFSFLTGSFLTYFIERRLQAESEKRQNKREHDIMMRDKIYGPIFQETTTILEKIETLKPSDFSSSSYLREISNHYLYSTLSQDLRTKLRDILELLVKYQSVRRATELMIHEVTKERIEYEYHIDIDGSEMMPFVSLKINATSVALITWPEIIMGNEPPLDLIKREKRRWGEDARVEITVGSQSIDVTGLTSVYELVLKELGSVSLFTEERNLKRLATTRLHEIVKSVEPFVNLE